MLIFFRIVFAVLTTWSITGITIAADLSAVPANGGTQRMVELLQEIHETSNPQQNPYLSEKRAALLASAIPRIEHPQELAQMQDMYANSLLDAGHEAEALEEFFALRALVGRYLGDSPTNAAQQSVNLKIGTTYLRIGEQDNCLLNHTIESCLFPISARGVHRATFGSSAAVGVFTEMLAANPDQLDAMWLLNIAEMTLGNYPNEVPEAWRIPESFFRSDYNIGQFVDVAGALGVDADDNSGGGVMDDFNGDGYLDLIVSSWGPQDPLRFFVSRGDGGFVEQTTAAGLTGLTGGLNLTHADYNNDGLPDVFVMRGAWLGGEGNLPNSLLKNLGGGRFEDVTEQAGLLSFHPTQTACWFDFDNDGNLDLFIGNESNEAARNHPCELYHNNGDGTFTEMAGRVGLDLRAFVKGVAAGDYDNDGRTDLFVSILGGTNKLFRNLGPAEETAEVTNWRFRDVADRAGVGEPLRSFPTWFWDYDNDGWEDLFVMGYGIGSIGDVMAEALGRPHEAALPRLYRNNHDGTFTDVTQRMGIQRIMLGMGVNFGDIDNDGWLDFYVGSGDTDFRSLMPNLMFRNNGGSGFQDVTTSGGFGHLQKGHGISFGDFDEDGDQDVHAVMGGAYPADHYRNALFQNPGHGNRWLKLKLEGTTSNRSALGARIQVNIKTPTGKRRISRTVSAGGSFGANPLRQEIGLDNAEAIESVEIKWPASGTTQTFTDLQLDHHYRITEGDDSPESVELSSFVVRAESADAMSAAQHDHSAH